MRFALLLLWLTTLAPAAHAADWLTWRRVGEATLTWGPFTVYQSQLRTPNGRYDGPQQDRALIITYRRDIDREALVDATRDQWQAQGILQQEPRSEAWTWSITGASTRPAKRCICILKTIRPVRCSTPRWP